jgi:hypothetical protein
MDVHPVKVVTVVGILSGKSRKKSSLVKAEKGLIGWKLWGS